MCPCLKKDRWWRWPSFSLTLSHSLQVYDQATSPSLADAGPLVALGQAYRNGCQGAYGGSDARADADAEEDAETDDDDDEEEQGANEGEAAGGKGDSRPGRRAAAATGDPRNPPDVEAEEANREGDSESEDGGAEVGLTNAIFTKSRENYAFATRCVCRWFLRWPFSFLPHSYLSRCGVCGFCGRRTCPGLQ